MCVCVHTKEEEEEEIYDVVYTYESEWRVPFFRIVRFGLCPNTETNEIHFFLKSFFFLHLHQHDLIPS